jgi:hypothetical protein
VGGKVHDLPVTITIDTGASKTLLSIKLFQLLPERFQCRLSNFENTVLSAEGRPIDCQGSLTLFLEMGRVKFELQVLVADIEDDMLLGMDILLDGPLGPADISLRKKEIYFADLTIPISCDPSSVLKARSADHYIIPGMCERILDVFVEPSLSTSSNTMLLESAQERSDLLVAPCLVNVNETPTVKVRVMNPFSSPISVKQDQVICAAEPVTYEATILDAEPGPNELPTARRLQTIQPGSVQPPVAASTTCVPSHIETLFEEAAHGKCESEIQSIASLLTEYEDCFSKNETDLGRTNVTEHAITTGDAKPIKQAPRRTPVAFMNEDKEALSKMLKQGTIRPSTSPWASPIVFVRKRNGKVRVCVDYRKVNAITEKDAYPLPRIADCLDSIAGSVLFSTMDITAAYNQVPVKEADIPKTAFITKHGLYEFVTMPFGLCNAPATFQRLMELTLQGLQWTKCLIYLDDVVVFSATHEEHIQRLKEVLERLKTSGLKLSPEKCHFFQPSVTFLGHVVSSEGIKPDPQNIVKLIDWPVPKSVRDVRAFLGFANYYRKYVKNFSTRAKTMTSLTKKNHTFQWTTDCQREFEDLKQALTSSDVMSSPTPDGTFILDTDASQDGIGAVLSQIQDGKERVIAYGSRTLTKSERNYCVTDKELLAVRYFVTHYKHYLLGRKFKVRTDHAAIKWLFSFHDPKARVARWIEVLSEFDFEVLYRKGVRHGNADGLSRCNNPHDCKCDIENDDLRCGPCNRCQRRSEEMRNVSVRTVQEERDQPRRKPWFLSALKHLVMMILCFLGTVFPSQGTSLPSERCQPVGCGDQLLPPVYTRRAVTRSSSREQSEPEGWTDRWPKVYTERDIKKMQQEDPDIKPILTWMKQGDRPHGQEVCKSNPATRHYWHNWKLLRLRNGILFREYVKIDGSQTFLQLVVPRAMRRTVLDQMHNSLLSGHLGQKKTREKTLQRYYWYSVREDVNVWIRQCDQCASIKTPTKRLRAPLGEMPVGAPLDRLATDILGPLPETSRGNKYILVVTDYFSKWVEIFPIPDFTAATCARVILNEVISRYGCPCDVHSDQGSNYESYLFQELCQLLEVNKTRTTPYNPRCNGLTERFNKTLIRMVKAYLKGEQRDWDLHLGCLAAAYRATPHEATGFSPNFLMLGREVRLPAEVLFGSPVNLADYPSSYGEYVDKLRERMYKAHEVSRLHLEANAKRHKQIYDGKTTFYTYNPGDLVWCLSEAKQLQVTPKLRRPYEGPYLVVWKLSDLDYIIQLTKDGKQRIVHHNLLRPYEGNLTFPWARAALKQTRNKWCNVKNLKQ